MQTIRVEKTSSKGIVIEQAFVIKKVDLTPASYKVKKEDIDAEIKKYRNAMNQAAFEIEKLAVDNDIFAGHLMIAKDEMLHDSVIDKIKDNRNGEQALFDSIAEFVLIFESMDDEYMRERAADVKDVGNRALKILMGIEDNALADLTEKAVIIAEDLTPSDTAIMDFDYVAGFITQLGGTTSHISIIARNIGLPALVGVEDILNSVKNGDLIIMDAAAGNIIINPDEATITKYRKLMNEFEKHQKNLEELTLLPSITLDGKSVELFANAGKGEEIEQANIHQAQGIGLFRSEFLYMENTHFPTEDEQYKVYKKAAELCNGDVIIRTLDIGGDKELPYYIFDKEENPFLGWRGIRISLDLEDVFKTQLRAILRASHFGKLKIMFPMIISVEEFVKAKEILELCKDELRAEKLTFNENIEVGIMVETPAAVMIIEDLAQIVDFISIGTNDLTQYILAVDRGNQKISNLYDSFHPAVLRSIQKIIETGHRFNKKIGMCGEFASDPKAVKVLLGMHLDEFSMSPKEINSVKDIIRNTTFSDAVELAEKVVRASTTQEVLDIILTDSSK